MPTLALLLAAAALAPAADRFKADNNQFLNAAASWVGGTAPGAADAAVWDATVLTSANLILGPNANVNWGGIVISNPPGTVDITNQAGANRQISIQGQGIRVVGQDLWIGNHINANSPQTWTVNPGRKLVLNETSDDVTADVSRDVNFNASVTLNGHFEYGRIIDVLSNATLTIGAGTDLVGTNGTGIFRIAQGATQVGTVSQTGGNVLLRRGSANAVLVIGNSAGGTGTWNLSGGVLDTRGDVAARINNQTVTVGTGNNSTGNLNISGTGQLLADVVNLATGENTNQVGNLSVSGTGSVVARNIVSGTRGLGTITVADSASVVVTNNLQLAGTSGETNGSGVINLNGGTLTIPNIARGGGFPNSTATVNLNGGQLILQRDNINFVPTAELVVINVLAGGANINTAGFSATNRSPLLHGAGPAVDGGLVKSGAGNLTLLGTNTYNGPTAVNAGTLGLSTAHKGGGAITLANGTGLNVQVNEIGGTAPISALTFGSGGVTTLFVDTITNGNPTAAVITATNLITSGTINVSIATAGQGLTVGQFTLIDYSGAIGGSGFAAFALVGLPLGVTANLVNTGSTIDLNVTVAPPNLTWNGNLNGVWDVGGTANWRAPGPVNAPFTLGATVIFDDTATGTTTITLNTNLIPGGEEVLFNNTTKNYSITGAGSFNGSFGLTKLGTGTVTLGTTNDYPGPTMISAGTFRLGANNVIPDGVSRGSLTLDGTLDLNGFSDAVNGFNGGTTGVVNNSAAGPATFIVGSNGVSGTFEGLIQNTGGALTLVKVGGGTNRFFSTTPNTHTGGNVFVQGIVEITNGSSLGSASAPLSLGSTLRPFGNVNNTAPTFTLIGNATFNLSNNAIVTIGASTIAAATNYTLVQNGEGTVNLSGSGTFGAVRVNQGRMNLNGGTINNDLAVNIGNIANVTGTLVLNGATLRVGDGFDSIDFNVANAANGTGVLHVTNNARLEVEDFFVAKVAGTVGTVFQSSGVVTNTLDGGDDFRIAGNDNAAHSTAVGIYNLSGGRLDVIEPMAIGDSGSGTMNISGTGEANSWSGVVNIGRDVGGVGVLNVNSGSFNQRNPNNNLNVGNVGSGTLNVGGSGLVTVAGNLVVGAGTNTGTVNLNSGGTIRTPRVIDGTGVSTFNFNGGTLEATAGSADFMRNLTNLVISSGAVIDTGTFAIGILDNLVEDDGNPGGGLIKLGSGDLTLSGTNTYTGGSTVNSGRLFVTPGYVGASDITVSDGAGLGARANDSGATATISSIVTLGSGGGTTFDFDLGTFGNPPNPVATIPNLTANGPVSVNITGANLTPGTFTLLSYAGGSIDGLGSSAFSLTGLPRGVDAVLVDNVGEQSIDLQINSIAPVIWTGVNGSAWDLDATLNWKVTNTPTTFQINDTVLFDNTASAFTVNLSSNMTQTGITVDNTTTYTFSGPGLITGSGGLTKLNTGVLVLANTNNTYAGPTVITAGTLRLGTNDVIPNGAGNGNVTNHGTLDLNGFNDTISGLDGSGIIDNTSGATNVTLIIGGGNTSGSYSGTIQDTGGDLTLQKNGNGTNVLLSASPAWGGCAFVNAGQLAFGHDNAFGSATVIVGGGGELATFNGPRTLANTISTTNTGEGDFTTDAGTLFLTGAINWAGAVDLNKRGVNNLRLTATAVANLAAGAELAVFGGTLEINGATVTIADDGLRTRATTNFNNVAVDVQNNATITLNSNATLNVGATATITNPAVVPASLTNTFTLGTGNITFTGNGGLVVGGASGNVGVFIHSGGTITMPLANSNGVTLGNASNTIATYRLNGGTLTVPRVDDVDTNDVTSTFVFGGGTLRASSGVSGTNFMAGLGQALVQAPGAFIDSVAFDVDVAQPLLVDPTSPNGGLVKNGSGSLALNGANTFSGAITVNAGLLRGRGSVVGNINGAGRIGGGDIDELGTLTVSGTSVAVTGGATLRVSHVGAILSNDKVSAPSGVITHAGELTLIPIGVDFAVGDQFDLFDAATINGSFTSYNLGLLPPGLSWDTTDVSTTGIVRIVRTTQVQTISKAGNVNQITLGGIGPAASTGYRVLSTTNMALPINLWTVYTNGTFDVSSNFSSVISVNSNDTRRFFIIINP